MEVKNAFTVLSNPQQKAEYDRKLRMVSQPAQGFVQSWPYDAIATDMLLRVIELTVDPFMFNCSRCSSLDSLQVTIMS